jgi:DNA-binding transcriptional ArsR family regulator
MLSKNLWAILLKSQLSAAAGEHGPEIDALISSAQEASAFLKALAHEARLLILCLLIDKEKSVTEIEETLTLRQPAISQQLARLRADRLVETRREGKNVFYSLARPEVVEVISALHRAFCEPPQTQGESKLTVVRPPVRARQSVRRSGSPSPRRAARRSR